MVRNSELPDVGQTAKIVAAYVSGLIDEQDLSQDQVAAIIGRAQSYASLRIKGLKPWSVDELDMLAPHLGLGSAFDIIAGAGLHSGIENSFTIAANMNPDKLDEEETPDE